MELKLHGRVQSYLGRSTPEARARLNQIFAQLQAGKIELKRSFLRRNLWWALAGDFSLLVSINREHQVIVVERVARPRPDLV